MRYGRFVGALMALSVGVLALVQPARAELSIVVDKSTQRMSVALNGEPMFVWPVSTGAPGYDTPSGTFTPFRMEKDHFSKEWDDAPMPHSVFFTMKGHAIHGSNHLKAMGTPASHGCVRLEPKNARLLFDLIKQEGMNKTRVSITGETPNAVPQVARREAPNAVPQVARRGDNYDVIDDEALAAAPPPRRRIVVREYRERPRGFYFTGRPYYHPYQDSDAPPPPYYYGR